MDQATRTGSRHTMKPKQFIEQSIEGGWKSKYHSDLDWNGDGFYVHILDPRMASSGESGGMD